MYPVWGITKEYVWMDTMNGVGNKGVPDLIQDVELMQFTGLHDKNGNEIWEGDIVKCHWNINKQYNPANDKLIPIEKKIQLSEVYYSLHFAGFSISANREMADEKYKDEIYITKYRAKTFLEIIGNKFENPELLK